MKNRVTDREEALFASNFPNVKQVILRPRTVDKINFANYPRPAVVEELIDQDIKRQISALNEQYRLEKRKVSGKEAYEIKIGVRAEHQALYIENLIKLSLWSKSERILRILRTKGLGPEPDDSTINQRRLDFIATLDLSKFPEADVGSPLYLGADTSNEGLNPFSDYTTGTYLSTGTGPNQYFELICPELVHEFGYPFFASVKGVWKIDGSAKECVIGINTDFFAAYLGGEKRYGNDVIFYMPESRFYFYDPMVQQYIPTTEQKIRLGLSLTLQERAWGLDLDQATMILNKFRSQAVFDDILEKAKAMLATERGFFEGPHVKSRLIMENQTANTIASTVKAFIESQVAVDESNVLTISECVAQLQSFCQERGESIPSYKEVKVVVQMKMREVYGKGLRNDLLLEDNRCVAGWKGLRLDHQVA